MQTYAEQFRDGQGSVVYDPTWLPLADIDDVNTKCDDVLDKCNDILEKV